MNCIFCKIVSGELPCSRILETDEILAFLDISPVEQGHTLIIPKLHVERYMDLPDRLLLPLATAARTISNRLCDVLKADGITLSQANGACAGQVVPHVHIHVIPRYDQKPMHFRNGSYESPATMESLAEDLRRKGDPA